jgi:hypothetical protein
LLGSGALEEFIQQSKQRNRPLTKVNDSV